MSQIEVIRSLINHDAVVIKSFGIEYNCIIPSFRENKVLSVYPSEEFRNYDGDRNLGFDLKYIDQIRKKVFGFDDVIMWERANNVS